MTSLLSHADFDELLEDADVEDHGGLSKVGSRPCPMGLLLSVIGGAGVEGGNRKPGSLSASSRLRATELLVYGVLRRGGSSGDIGCNNLGDDIKRPMPTPPPPPSPPLSLLSDGVVMLGRQQDCRGERELRLYAVPLSSSLIVKAQSLPSPPLSPGIRTNSEIEDGDWSRDGGACFAEFVPDIHFPSPKRKRMATLFDSADQRYQKMQRRGGEMVSKIMATGVSKSQQQLIPSLPPVKKEPPSIDDTSKPNLLGKLTWHHHEQLGRNQRSRSLSMNSHGLRGTVKPGDIDPEHELLPTRLESAKSLARPPALARRSSSSRGLTNSDHVQDWSRERETSVTPHDLLDLHNKRVVLEQSEHPQRGQEIVLENKALLTRTILTCMRLYGYHRKAGRGHSSSSSGAATLVNKNNSGFPIITQHEESEPSFVDDGITENILMISSGQLQSRPDEDGFRAMYNATYKAAFFALRRYLRGWVSEGAADNQTVSSSNLTPRLEKEKATNVVDDLLRLFCEEA